MTGNHVCGNCGIKHVALLMACADDRAFRARMTPTLQAIKKEPSTETWTPGIEHGASPSKDT